MRIGTMLRIAIWSSGGAVIALAWGYYLARANKALPLAPVVGAVAGLTPPVVSAVLAFDPAARIGLHSSTLANAAGYGLIGLFVETIRQYCRSGRALGSTITPS
jgi:hypothetical protein